MSREIPPTRRGYSPFEVISALQKAVRRSQVKDAVYWAMEMYVSGHKTWVWNRVQVIASEDIGPADRYLPAQIATLRQWSKDAEKREGGGMELVQAVILLATAKKSHVASWMVLEAVSDHHERLDIPDHALDQHTRRGKQMGRGHEHFLAEGAKVVQPGTDEQIEAELERLNAEAEEHWRKVMSGETADLPLNPKRRSSAHEKESPTGRTVQAEPAQNAPSRSFGQLRLDSEDRR